MIAIGLTVVLLLLVISVRRGHALTAAISVIGLGFALCLLFVAWSVIPLDVTSLLIVDGYAIFYQGLMIGSGIVLIAMSYGYFEKQEVVKEEFYPLLLLAVLGASVLASSRHFASFFLGLEILSISLYAMSGYIVDRRRAIEAAIKYLILAAVATAFLLFGMALVYTETGFMDFGEFASISSSASQAPFFLVGISMIMVAMGFKLALVPFHLWTPDVYEGAPAPATALIASISKAGVFAFLFRHFSATEIYADSALGTVFTIIAVASMFTGALLALLQENVKRLLAYSSISHMGYLIVPLLVLGEDAALAGTLYITAYVITSLGAFGIVSMLSRAGRDADGLSDYQGLAWTSPLTAAIFTFMMLSLAGLPLTAGFIGKFFVLASGVRAELWLLVVSLVISSIIGLYAYLRVIVRIFQPRVSDPSRKEGGLETSVSVFLTALLLFIGIYPGPLIAAIKNLLLISR